MLAKQLNNAVRLALRSSSFAPTLRKILRKSPLSIVFQIGQEKGWDNAALWLLSAEGNGLLENPRLHLTLRNSINTDIQTELLFTEVRKILLLGKRHLLEQPNIQETICSLISQAINNEYIWYISEDEYNVIYNLRKQYNHKNSSETYSWKTIALLAMYNRLSIFLEDGVNKDELLDRIEEMPPCITELIDTYLSDYEEEQSIKKNLKALVPINHSTSKIIAENYEEYPYPRWIDWDFPQYGQRNNWLKQFYSKKELNFLEKPFNVLVAGCGTGSKAIEYAIGYGQNASIFAIDLSRASLAYATRMARKYNVKNIKFYQMDILDLPKIDKQFDIIECTGVLHHMKDPLEGGKALVYKLRKEGILHISLYSELARREIVRFRQEYNLTPDMSSNDIRIYRRYMMQDKPEIIDDKLSLRWDFFDMNRCKDLLFHPLEHRYTVPKIEKLLDALGMEFRGLETPDIIRTQYWTHYPKDKDRRNLSRWHEFEKKNPDAFGNLYEIWSIKN